MRDTRGMADQTRPVEISADDWAATPGAVRALIEQLLVRLNELEAQLNRPPTTSRNSSQPPSRDQKSDRVSSKRRRRRGAKPGHAKAERPLSDTPDQVVEARVSECAHCQADLREVEAERVFRRQIVELPVVRPLVLETRQHEVCCPACDHLQRGVLPEGLEATRHFGPRLEGVVVYLKHQQHLSYDRLQRVLTDLFGVTLSDGGETCILRRAGEAAQPEAERIGEHVRQSRVINSDETSGRVDGVKHWEWVFVSAAGIYHLIHQRRSAEVIDEFMRDRRAWVWGCDCFPAQLNAPTELFQLCLAHQLRDLQKVLDLFPRARWAAEMQTLFRQAIHLAKRRATLTTRGFQAQVTRVERALDRLLARRVKHKEARKLQDRYQTHRAHLLVFLHHPEVPYDNNVCERALRPSVIHRKVIGGFRSTWGAQAYAALATVVDTAKLFGRNVFETIVALMGKPVLPFFAGQNP
jgi:transposase